LLGFSRTRTLFPVFHQGSRTPPGVGRGLSRVASMRSGVLGQILCAFRLLPQCFAAPRPISRLRSWTVSRMCQYSGMVSNCQGSFTAAAGFGAISILRLDRSGLLSAGGKFLCAFPGDFGRRLPLATARVFGDLSDACRALPRTSAVPDRVRWRWPSDPNG